jgi:hypothetical protein
VFAVAAGASRVTTPNVWGTTSIQAAIGQVNLVASTSNTFLFGGVVVLPGIEAPSAARSPLIMRPYDQELLTCKRYFYILGDAAQYPVLGSYAAAAAANFFFSLPHPVTMRAAPTATKNGTWTTTNCGQPALNSAGISGIAFGVAATAAGGFFFYPSAAGQNFTCDARF